EGHRRCLGAWSEDAGLWHSVGRADSAGFARVDGGAKNHCRVLAFGVGQGARRFGDAKAVQASARLDAAKSADHRHCRRVSPGGLSKGDCPSPDAGEDREGVIADWQMKKMKSPLASARRRESYNPF